MGAAGNHTTRKIDLYGRHAQPFLNEFLKEIGAEDVKGDFSNKKIDIDKGNFIFASHKGGNIHSLILDYPETKRCFVLVKDGRNNILKLFPKDCNIFYCMEPDAFPGGIIGLDIDRETDYIVNTKRYERTVRIREAPRKKGLTKDPVLNDFTSYNLKQLMQLPLAKEVDYTSFIRKYNSGKGTAFIL